MTQSWECAFCSAREQRRRVPGGTEHPPACTAGREATGHRAHGQGCASRVRSAVRPHCRVTGARAGGVMNGTTGMHFAKPKPLETTGQKPDSVTK